MRTVFFVLGLVFIIITVDFKLFPLQMPQGIAGYVYLQRGNHMPMKGLKQIGKGKPLNCCIEVHAATRLNDVIRKGHGFSVVNSAVITTAYSDSSGHFKISLPVGKYSVFIKEDSLWYADQINAEGYLNPVVIAPGVWQQHDFVMRGSSIY